MKKHSVLLVMVLLLVPLTLFALGSKESIKEENSLTVYAYDSFVSEWGPGPLIIEEFEKQSGIKVNLISAGHGGELLTRLNLERSHPRADIVVGIESELIDQALASKLFLPYKSGALKDIPSFLHVDPSYTLLPFNYGNYAFVYDSDKISDPPTSLENLLNPKWRKSLILIDPRTSNVGMGLLQWSVAQFGEEYLRWWEELKPNILTISDGWSSAYGLFTQHEAPLVISYTTSPIYHILYEESERYKAIAFDEGNMMVVETAAILASTHKEREAQMFIDFLLTEAQVDIAVTNVMYPVNSSVKLPAAFDKLPKVTTSLTLDNTLITANRERWLKEWTEVMSK